MLVGGGTKGSRESMDYVKKYVVIGNEVHDSMANRAVVTMKT